MQEYFNTSTFNRFEIQTILRAMAKKILNSSNKRYLVILFYKTV